MTTIPTSTAPAPVNFEFDAPGRDLESLKRSIANKLMFVVGKDPAAARPEDWLHAAAYAVRDQLVERWMTTTRAQYAQDAKRVYYLSMEFLIGRTFSNAMLAVGLRDRVKQALADFGVDIDAVTELEPDAALGNGGLGRLAACFLDSMATLNIPGFGYGIRYDYGMFKQTIVDGRQVEVPDYWLTHGNPWEFPRPEVTYRVQFGGHVVKEGDAYKWVDSHDVQAMAYDTIIPGYATKATNTLRLWSAKATQEIDLGAFNRGNYMAAVETKNHSENVSRVLYPDDSTPSGRELRLHQEYFFCSASVQDLLRRYLRTHDNFENLPNKVSIHLNDTHPVLAIPELMRLLLDEHHLPWADAWRLCQGVFSYTNHTLMHEALETWPVEMMGRILPRHLQIIYDINAQFLAQIAQRGGSPELLRKVSLVDETGERRVRMAYLAVVTSHSVNGVSALHSELMKESIFFDFANLWPERFNNKTNGITPRRWLAQANPALSAVLDKQVGTGWRRDLTQLSGLNAVLTSPKVIEAFQGAKLANKQRLAAWVQANMGLSLPTDALYDVQVKRIHEYKRQLLNVLHVVTRYLRIINHPGSVTVPRVVVFAGKAASAYHMAKQIIHHLINNVASVINKDPRVGQLLKVVFIPNYSVSLAERIIPAADLSEQISTAGTEASGTGNMKFALNGALTIGTLDGANVEILENVGADNIFIFGMTTPEVAATRAAGYQPRAIAEGNAELTAVLEAIRDGVFSPDEPGRFQSIYDLLVNWGDHYLLLADYAAYIAAQERVDAAYQNRDAWAIQALRNVAAMGPFSADRTIGEYADKIWRSKPLELAA